jgi:hypothetical protein
MDRVQVFDVNETLLDLAALAMTAEQAGVELNDPDRDAIGTGMRRPPSGWACPSTSCGWSPPTPGTSPAQHG